MSSTNTQNPLGPAGLRALKIAIAVMTIMIFVGLAMVAVRIVQLSSQPKTTSHTPVSPQQNRIAAPLPPGAKVTTMALSGDRLAVHYKSAGTASILIIDLKSGKSLTRIDLTPGPSN